MNDVIDIFREVPRIVWFGLVVIIILGLTLAYLTRPGCAVTIRVSEPGSSMTVSGKTYEIDGKAKTIQLKPGSYTLTVYKPGYDTSESELEVPSGQTNKYVNIKLRPVVSQELTAVLPKSINQGGDASKVVRATYYNNRSWAVAEVTRFSEDSEDVDTSFAIFKLVDGKWQLVLGPATEFEDAEFQIGLPANVLANLNKRLSQ